MGAREILRTDKVQVRTMELEKDGATEWHYHTEVTDYFVCLKRVIRVETRNPNGNILLLPGQQAEVPPMMLHRVCNSSDGRAEYLLIQGVGAYDFCREGSQHGG